MATHHHGHGSGHHHAGQVDAVEATEVQGQASAGRADGPVLTTVNPGYLLLTQQATEPGVSDLPAAPQLRSPINQVIVATPSSQIHTPEAPPPR
ncbi:MAG: hypothetical protein KF883_08915 [Thermomicrobiales bacterium]|nr:hypothetical protein [Thermomicrobiales bacterium]